METPAPLNDLLKTLLGPVLPVLGELDLFMQDQVGEFEEDIREPVRYALAFSGKRLRPLMLFYAAGLAAEENPPPSSGQLKDLVRAAAVVEMIHLATLVHDDILDRAALRRSMPTLEKKFGIEVAVLLGDALFAHALRMASEFPTVSVCRTVSLATRRVCAGEIAQSFARGRPFLSRQEYYRHIELKTAELFAASGFLGAELAGGSPAWALAMEGFCRKLGMAYQIFDDLADILALESKAGKTLMTDLTTGKLTLPVIILLEGVPEAGRADLLQSLQSTTDSPEALRQQLMESGCPGRCAREFCRLLDEAEALMQPFADQPAHGSCVRLSDLLRSQLATLPLEDAL